MDRERAKELLPIITAFAEGKEIELKVGKDTWKRVYHPTWENNMEYRVKPEPRKFYLVKGDWNTAAFENKKAAVCAAHYSGRDSTDIIEVVEVLKDGQ